MNNYVKVFAGMVILVALWAGISFVNPNKQSGSVQTTAKKTEEACNTSSGGG